MQQERFYTVLKLIVPVVVAFAVLPAIGLLVMLALPSGTSTFLKRICWIAVATSIYTIAVFSLRSYVNYIVKTHSENVGLIQKARIVYKIGVTLLGLALLVAWMLAMVL